MPADPATLLAHDPTWPDGAVVPPIHQTSLFAFESYAALAAAFDGTSPRPIYSRGDNPTVQTFGAKLATLEGAEAARGFASGMGAISAAVLSRLESGQRLVAVRNCYPDAYRLFEHLLPRLGITVTYVDGDDLDAVARALPGAGLLYLESPTSLVFDTHDLAALAGLARAAGVFTIVDNSWATPLVQRPLALGCDMVVHSASKYLSGHSDTVAGVIAGRAGDIARVNELTYPYLGAKLSPFDAWLLVRGMRTLPLRMRRHEASGLAVARWLESHPAVTRVRHPGLRPVPSLRGASGLFSFELAGLVDIPTFCDALRLFRLGVSWGGHESLVFPALVGLGQAGSANALRAFEVSPRLVRLSIGLEAPEDLMADLEQALAGAGS